MLSWKIKYCFVWLKNLLLSFKFKCGVMTFYTFKYRHFPATRSQFLAPASLSPTGKHRYREVEDCSDHLICALSYTEKIFFPIQYRTPVTTTLYRDNIFATSYWSGTKFLSKPQLLSAINCVKRETIISLSLPIKLILCIL